MNRREFLKTVSAGVAVTCSVPVSLGAKKKGRKGRPNVIVIMADDISAKELPTYGIPNPTYGDAPCCTPVMARMKRQGVQFKNAWATPLCHPSRGMIMTGRYAHRTGWWSNGFSPAEGEKGYPLYGSHLTIGQIAKIAGYAGQMVGKWQLGGTQKGYAFDEYVMTPGKYAARAPAPKKGKPSFYWNPGYTLTNHPDYPDSQGEKGQTFRTIWQDFAPDIELKFMKDFMKRQSKAGKPFVVYWAAHLGHGNWDFDSNRMGYPGVPERDRRGKWTGRKTPPGINYHVQYLDYCLGELIEHAENLAIAGNTIVLFTTDNGTTEYGKGLKGAVKEHGAKVPLIVYGPGLVKPRGEVDELASLADVAPTLVELTGAKLPDGYDFDGESLVPLLTGRSDRHRDWIYSYNAEFQMVRTRKVVRDGLGFYWDTRHTVDQEQYKRVEPDTADLELRNDIWLIEQILKKYPTAPTSGPMHQRYMKEKATKRERWEKIKAKILKKKD